MRSDTVGTNDASANGLGNGYAREERTIAVYCWRMEQLLQAGYTYLVADALAEDSSVDLHAAVELLGSGCPLETAVRILL